MANNANGGYKLSGKLLWEIVRIALAVGITFLVVTYELNSDIHTHQVDDCRAINQIRTNQTLVLTSVLSIITRLNEEGALYDGIPSTMAQDIITAIANIPDPRECS